ncbi:hypothetical protein CANINC_000086 [Pichia inconspicua]|uniref:Uncharacterized protein n=1 Tax=Pichia inconspicua TaxID=52247 RepID=A0A4V4NGB4_9ASCO|nr:hypothetical protein CANINC_000086 [[Candida] inconspicua]
MIPISKLSAFTSFLSSNPQIINSIQSIKFSSNEIDSTIASLLKLLISLEPKNLQEIKFDSPNNDFLFFLIDNNDGFKNRSPNRLNKIYENDELLDTQLLSSTPTQPSPFAQNPEFIDIKTLMKSSSSSSNRQLATNIPLHLKTLQLFSVYDVDLIKNNNLDFTKLEISIQNALFDNPLDMKTIKSLSNSLKSLKILNTASFDYVSEAISKYVENNPIQSNSLFPNLEVLTLTLTEKNNIKTLQTLDSICFQKLKNLEVKFSRSSTQSVESENLKIVDLLNSNLSSNQLTAVSIINLNNYNMLNDNIFRNEIFDDTNLCFALLNHSNLFTSNSNLKYLNICLNTFLTVVRAVKEGSNSYKTFVVDDHYFDRKRELFNKILDLKSLTTLIIPDFLFNWLPFLDFGINFNTDYDNNYADLTNTTSTMIIRNLYTRFKDFEVKSGLDIVKNPINFNGRSILLDFYLNELAPIMIYIANNLPNLTLLNLGGLVVTIHRSVIDPTRIEKLEGVYDSWVFTNCQNQ